MQVRGTTQTLQKRYSQLRLSCTKQGIKGMKYSVDTYRLYQSEKRFAHTVRIHVRM
ncbi:hypothetical protein SAMN04487770_1771, partial [Butyrivibrio sp. ob235]